MKNSNPRSDIMEKLKIQPYHIESGQNITVDLFKPEDALGVAHCYYATYGEKFPMDYVYDPDAIITVNDGDEHFTVVARTEDGGVVGLAGLFRGGQDSTVYEHGQLMVLKAFRGEGVGDKLTSYILNEMPGKIGAATFFGEALCNHTISQKIVANHGFEPCAMEIEIMPSEAFDSEGGTSRRVSLLMMFQIFADKPQSVFIPQIHRDFFEKVYAKLALPRDFAENLAQPSAQTDLDFSSIPEAGIIKVVIRCIGGDLREQVAQIVEKENDDSIVHVQFNLADPHVDWACSQLKKDRFFLGGLLPLWFGTDGMFVQRLPETPDFNAIQMFSADAEYIMDRVRDDFEAINK